jgi:hypothetical protein
MVSGWSVNADPHILLSQTQDRLDQHHVSCTADGSDPSSCGFVFRGAMNPLPLDAPLPPDPIWDSAMTSCPATLFLDSTVLPLAFLAV